MNRRQNQIIKKVWMLLSFCLLTFLPLTAQIPFTQQLQKSKAGEGSVMVSHSPEIDRLVNGNKEAAKDASQPATATTVTTKSPTTTTPKPVTTKTTTQTGTRDTVSVRHDAADTTDADSHKKVMRGGYKTWGYRIQVYAGGNQRKDRQQATRIGNEIKTLFPAQPVYVHFYSPRWICRMGNYRTYEEAHQMLVSVKKMGYNAATVIKDKITVYNP